MVTRFCISRFLMGNWIPTCCPTVLVTTCIIRGRVKSVMILLIAVSETESATSPFASILKILLELPPGQHAINTKPMVKIGSRCMTNATAHANNGIINCPKRPPTTAFPLFITKRKSFASSVSPKQNISNVRIGSTIKILFIYALSKICLQRYGIYRKKCLHLRQINRYNAISMLLL